MKYHNHKLQTNPWYREEEPHNNHETPGRQTKQRNQLSLPPSTSFVFFKTADFMVMIWPVKLISAPPPPTPVAWVLSALRRRFCNLCPEFVIQYFVFFIPSIAIMFLAEWVDCFSLRSLPMAITVTLNH